MEPTAVPAFEPLPFSDPFFPPSGAAGWGAILCQHEGSIRARVARLLDRLGQPVRREMLDEILQDVYCRFFEEALRRWRGRTVAELLAYVGKIAERITLDHVRVARTGRRCGVRQVRLGRRIEMIADPRDPEQDLLHAEAQRLVLRRCRELSSHRGRRRNVWVARLSFLEGWTNREIAGAAGGRISADNVACLVHRFRRRLARQGFGRDRRQGRRAV